jgi:hypothetical protein
VVNVPQLSFNVVREYSLSSTGIEVPIVLSVGADRRVALPAKIDTGAASCIFQRGYADALGLGIDDGERRTFSTATGSFETRGHLVTLSCMQYDVESLVFFAVDEDFPRNVLGLHGWLERFRFGLVHYDRKIYLSHYDE